MATFWQRTANCVIIAMFLSCGVESGDEYAPTAKLDDCGQRCPASCGEDKKARLCRCDTECVRFGDCCFGRERFKCDDGAPVMKPLRGLECREIRLGGRETYWMVSSCPDTQNILGDETMSEINEMCANGSDTLPPVTDLDSGVVYKNEYCAVCHRITNIISWVYRFECLDCSHGPCPDYVAEIIQNECVQFGFSIPRAAPLPRSCVRDPIDLNALSSCLPRNKLEKATRRTWVEKEYTELEKQCTSGPLKPVASSANPCAPITYRNQYCSICNGDKPASLTCTDVKKRSAIPYPNFQNKSCLSLPQCNSPIHPDNATSRLLSSTTDNNKDMMSRSRETKKIDLTSRDTNIYNTSLDDNIKGNTSSGEMSISPEESSSSGSSSSSSSSGGGSSSSSSSSGGGGSDSSFSTPEDITVTYSAPRAVIIAIRCIPTNEPVYVADASFTVFFDVNRHSRGIKSGNNEKPNIHNPCQKDEVFNPFTKTCRKAICPKGFDTQTRLCPILVSNTSNGTIICNGYPLVLKESMFRFIDNNTVIFNGEYFNIIDYNNSMPIICINETLLPNKATFFYPTVLVVLTYVCCSLSAIGCAFVLLTYSLFKELRALPGRILMNLTAAVLATYLFLLIGNPLANATKKQEICEATAIFLHWLMLSQFFWMSIMSFEMVRIMYQANKLRQVESSTVANKMFLLYFSIGWGIPATIILVLVVVNFTTDAIQYGKDGVCWIGQTASFFAAFLTPVILFILFNGITFMVTFTFLFRASREQAKLNTQNKKSFIRITIGIFSITGLTWIFGFVALLAKEIWVWCFYIILTSTQGLFICIAFTFTQKIFSMYKNKLRRQLKCLPSFVSSSKQATQITKVDNNTEKFKEDTTFHQKSKKLKEGMEMRSTHKV